jgi:hypothetical protein
LGIEEGRQVLREIEKLTAPKPKGIGLSREAVGSLVEMSALLTDVMWETRPFNGGEFFAASRALAVFFRTQASSGGKE